MNVVDSIFSKDMCEYCQRYDLLDMLNDAVLLIDAENGNILFMNQKALSMYQYDKSEMSGLSFITLNHDARETIRSKMDMVKNQAKRGYVFTANQVKKNGTLFKVEISARFLAMHGKHIIAALIRDLTVDGKMREEIAIAGKIQRRLLPRNLETILFRMRTIYQPLDTLSGDLYDIQYNDDSQILYGIIIDVMGHGIGATSQGGILRYLFRRAVEKCIAINDKLAWINNEVIPFFSGGGFAAALLFEFDFKCKTLSYSSAGINQFLHLDSKGSTVIKSPGLFLGINEDESYDQSDLTFQSGDSFFFLTDGLFEMLDQPIENSHNFWSMCELCKELPARKTLNDDASGIGILVR